MSEGDPAILDNPTTDWKESVSEEFRGGVDRFENVDNLAKSYIELEKSMGSRVKIPGEDATPEDRSAFYGKLGVPDSAEGYTMPELLEGEVYNEEVLGKFKAIALENNISNEAFSAMAAEQIAMQKELKAAEAAAADVEYERHKTEGDRILHEKLGAAYDENIKLSSRAYTEYASEDLMNILDQPKYESLKNEPAFIEMFAEIGKKQMDDVFIKGNGQPPLDTDFVPAFPDSPDMYKNGTDEDSIKARKYFQARGHTY